MTIYYIRIDTERKDVGFRRETYLDNVNDGLFAKYWYGLKANLLRIGSSEWSEIDSVMGALVNNFDEIGKSRGMF